MPEYGSHAHHRAARVPWSRRRRLTVTLLVTGVVVVTLAVGAALLLSDARPLTPGGGAGAAWTPWAPVAPTRPGIVATSGVDPGLEREPGPQLEPTPEPGTAPFDAARALATVRELEAFGVRVAGTDAETNTAHFIAERLSMLGYSPVVIEDVPLPNGCTSHNVITRADGTSSRVIVLGAHMDSKAPSPGANDNGTGCAALLEMARILAKQPVAATVEFVFFGAEETIDKDPNHHHYGSRHRVAAMSAAEMANTVGMISVDMIGYGPDFVVRTMLRGPRTMSDLLLSASRKTGSGLTFLKDPGTTGWSDHEAYELAGIPSAWIEWRDDPVYHTAKDTSGHLKVVKVRVAGQLVLDALRGLNKDALEELVTR
jgi:hypothetical protein